MSKTDAQALAFLAKYPESLDAEIVLESIEDAYAYAIGLGLIGEDILEEVRPEVEALKYWARSKMN